MANAFQFDLADVILTWGSFMIDGAGDGNFISIAYDNPRVVEHEGGHGDVTILLTKSKKGTATIVLGQASPANAIFSAALATQQNGGGLIKRPLTLTHKHGTSKAFARTAYLRDTPELAFGMEHNNREWELGLADLELFIGGSLR